MDAVMRDLESVVGRHDLRELARGFEFTEGPVWRPAERDVVFSDIPASAQYVWNGVGAPRLWRSPTAKANRSTRDRQDRLVSCEHETSRVVRHEPGGAVTVVADRFDGRELNSPNDVVVDSAGRVYFTDPPFGRTEARMGRVRPLSQRHSGVYVVHPAGRIDLLASELPEPNGLCLSLDERFLFVNDTASGRIVRFGLTDGAVTTSSLWATVSGTADGLADGMKLDAAGNLYCTGPGGIHVFSPEGEGLGVIEVPEPVGNFAFIGDQRDTLFICASEVLYLRAMATPGPRSR